MGGTAMWRASDEIIAKGTRARRRHPGGEPRPISASRTDGSSSPAPTAPSASSRSPRSGARRASRSTPIILEARAPHLPQRHACRRGRGRSRDRPRRRWSATPASTTTACWSIRWSSPARRMARWRRAAARRCWSTAPTTPDSGQMVAGILHGLRHAARRRPAVVRSRLQQHALHDQSAGREGLRRGRRDRGLPGDRQRHPRCAGAARRHRLRRARRRRPVSGRRSQAAR